MDQITVAGVSFVTATLIQIGVLYIPKLNAWFAGLKSEVKQLVFIGVDFGVAAGWLGILVAKCFELAGIVCPPYEPATAVQVFLGLGALFLANVGIQQAVYLIAPKPVAVEDAKYNRPL